MKDKLSGQFMKEFVKLREIAYCYLKDINEEDKKQKAQNVCYKKCVIKAEIKCKNIIKQYKNV